MRLCPHRVGEEIEFNDSTNPNSVWPSTSWSQVTDGRVTLASSSSHALGSTGGAETHTLTVSEMPSHTHRFRHEYGVAGSSSYPPNKTYAQVAGDQAGTKTWLSNPVEATGGGQAHNNMQPWRAVNRWRRVA